MTGPTIYPPADHTTQWYNDAKWGGITMPMHNVKWVQHTTETAGGWPTYDRGGGPGEVCPTLTYEPWQHKWRQHLPINHSARALVNDGGNYTNRCDVVQTEISCYCDPNLAKTHGHFVEDLDTQALDDLAAFAVWMHQQWGMAIDWHPDSINWPRYNGQQPFTRTPWAQYETYSGILGHISVPGNVHLDPGSLDNVTIRNLVQQKLGGQDKQMKWPLVDDAAVKAFAAVHAIDELSAALKATGLKWAIITEAEVAAEQMRNRAKHQAMVLHEVNDPPK